MSRSYGSTMVGVCLVVALGLLTGCLGNRDWSYPPASTGAFVDAHAKSPVGATAAVLPFEDLRGTEVKEEYWKAAIPLVWSGTTSYDRPETIPSPEPVDVVNFDPPKDFARAAAEELNQAGIFSSVVYAEDGTAPATDLVFRGRLQSTEWERELQTYLLGPLGVIPWLLGVPMGETETEVVLDMQLTSASDPSQVLWHMTMDYEGKKQDSPYYNLQDAVESYPIALQEALRPAILDLIRLAEEDPGKLSP